MSFLEKLLELGKLLIWATAKCAPIGRDSATNHQKSTERINKIKRR
jgi:hypothetical protein